jgi:hypothetical protein
MVSMSSLGSSVVVVVVVVVVAVVKLLEEARSMMLVGLVRRLWGVVGLLCLRLLLVTLKEEELVENPVEEPGATK